MAVYLDRLTVIDHFLDVFLSNADQRLLIRLLLQLQVNLAGSFSLISSPKSPKMYCKIVSGVFPTSNNVVIEWISLIFSSRAEITASESTWHQLDDKIRLPDGPYYPYSSERPVPQKEGVCSEVA
mgnify:CR=1 FL=1